MTKLAAFEEICKIAKTALTNNLNISGIEQFHDAFRIRFTDGKRAVQLIELEPTQLISVFYGSASGNISAWYDISYETEVTPFCK